MSFSENTMLQLRAQPIWCPWTKALRSTPSWPHVNPVFWPPDDTPTSQSQFQSISTSNEDACRWSAHNGVGNLDGTMEFAIAQRVSHNNKSNRKADDPRRRSTSSKSTRPGPAYCPKGRWNCRRSQRNKTKRAKCGSRVAY